VDLSDELDEVEVAPEERLVLDDEAVDWEILLAIPDVASQEAIEPYSRSEDEKAAAAVLEAAARYVRSGVVAITPESVRSMIQDYELTAPLLAPLPERQLLVNLSVRGGGHRDERRAQLFALRELAIVALYLLGYADDRIRTGLDLGRSQVLESALLKQLRTFVRVARAHAIRSLVSELKRFSRRGGGQVSLEYVARRFGLSRRQVERILGGSVDRDDIRAAVGFGARLGEQPAEVRAFVQKCLFHWLYPTIAEDEDRPFEFFGIPLQREVGEPYHSWLHENDLRELALAAERFPSLASQSSPSEGGGQPEPAWFIPGRSGVLPRGLWGVLNEELLGPS